MDRTSTRVNGGPSPLNLKLSSPHKGAGSATTSPKRQSSGPNTPAIKDGQGGDLATIVRDLESDESLRVFLSPDFSAEKHVGTAVREERLSPALSTASRAAEMLNTKMHEEIIQRQDALLRGVESLDALQSEIKTVSDGVSGVGKATQGLETSLAKPYHGMDVALVKLRNLHATSELLRALDRSLRSLQSLKDANLYPSFSSNVETPHERLALAAAGVTEIDTLFPLISNLSIISSAITPVKRAKAELRRRATAAIKTALSSQNEPALTSALKALRILGLLPQVLTSESNRLSEFASSAIGKVFDISATTSALDLKRNGALSSTPKLSTSPSEIWTRIDNMLTGAKEAGQEVIMLEAVAVTHEDLRKGDHGRGLYKKWLESIGRAFERHCNALLRRSKESRSTSSSNLDDLIDIYPSLRTRVAALTHERLPQCSETILKSMNGLEGAYLTTSFTRVTDAVNAVFDLKRTHDVQNTHDTEEDEDQLHDARVYELVEICRSELLRAKGNPEMHQHQVRNIAKGMRLFISHASDHYGIANVEYKTTSRNRWKSRRVYQGLVLLCQSAKEWSRTLQGGSRDSRIDDEIKNASALVSSMTRTLFKGVRDDLEASIMSVQSVKPEVVMSAVRTTIEQVSINVTKDLYPSAPLGRELRKLARLIFHNFVRNVLVLDFREQEIRKEVEISAMELEERVSLICDPKFCGRDYQALRSLRIMLLLPFDCFCDSESLSRLNKGLEEYQIILYLVGTTGFVMSKEERLKFVKMLDTSDLGTIATRVDKHLAGARREKPSEKAWRIVDWIKAREK